MQCIFCLTISLTLSLNVPNNQTPTLTPHKSATKVAYYQAPMIMEECLEECLIRELLMKKTSHSHLASTSRIPQSTVSHSQSNIGILKSSLPFYQPFPSAMRINRNRGNGSRKYLGDSTTNMIGNYPMPAQIIHKSLPNVTNLPNVGRYSLPIPMMIYPNRMLSYPQPLQQLSPMRGGYSLQGSNCVGSR